MTKPAVWLAMLAVLCLLSCGGHGHSTGPQQSAALRPAPQLDGWSMPDLPGTAAPQPADPASVRERLRQFDLPLPATAREASGVVKHLPDDTLSVHGSYPTPGFYDFRVSTPFEAQARTALNITGSLTFSGPLKQRYVQVGLVNNATYNYALDPDGNPLTNDANPSYLFNQNVLMVCAQDTAGHPFAAPLDYNNSAGVGQGQGLSGSSLSFSLKLLPSGATGGSMALSINGGPFGPAHVYGTNNWGWWPAESFAQARLVVQVYSYNPDPSPFTVAFSNVIADDPGYTPPPPPPAADWVHSWGGGHAEHNSSNAVDHSGNVNTAGATDFPGPGVNADALLQQFNACGSLNWAKAWGGPGDDALYGVCTDAAGNIYAAGDTRSFGGTKALLLKYSAGGELQLARTYGLAEPVLARWVALAPNGDIFLVGYTAGSPGNIVVARLDPAGSLLWATRWGGHGPDIAFGGCLGSDGNLYVVGNTASFGSGALDMVLLQIDGAGNVLAQRTWGKPAADETAVSVAEGAGGKLYVVGTQTIAGTAAIALKVDMATLDLDWANSWYGSFPGDDLAGGVACPATGVVYVEGWTGSFAPQPGLFVLGLDSTGNLLSQQKGANQFRSTYGTLNNLSLAPDGSLVLTGAIQDVKQWDWMDIAGVYGTPAGTWQSRAGPAVAAGGVVAAAAGTESAPVGVLDTGGGDWDALVIKHLIPGLQPAPTVQIDATALANAQFSIWDPAGPTPYTGSLSTNSIFDASQVLLEGDQFYLSFAADPALAPDDLLAYPPRPDGNAGGYCTVTPGGLTLGGTLATWFTVPPGTQTLVLKPGAYNRITNDLAAGLPDALYTLRDTNTLATLTGPWPTNASSVKHEVLASGVNYRPVFSGQAYPLGGSSAGHNGAAETIYPSEWTLNWFAVGNAVLTEQGSLASPDMRDYFTQTGLVNKLDADAFVRLDLNAGGVVDAPYTLQVSPAFPNISPAMNALPAPNNVITLAKSLGLLSFRARDNSGNLTPAFTVDMGRKLNLNQTQLSLAFGGSGGALGLAVLPVRVADDPDASDPAATVTGSGPWDVALYFLLQYGRPDYSVQLDADYGTAWDDGTPGRVYSVAGSPFNAPGLTTGSAKISNQPPGTYKFALRVTDANGAQYTYIWPDSVTLP